MALTRSQRASLRAAKLSDWYQKSLAPLKNKGDEADLTTGNMLLDELKQTRMLAFIIRTYQRQQTYADFLLENEAKKRETRDLPPLRPYRIPALKSIVELHRRVTLINLIPDIEEKIADYSTKTQVLQSRIAEFEETRVRIKNGLSTCKTKRSQIKIEEKISDINHQFALEEKEIRTRLETTQHAFKLSLSRLTDEKLVRQAIEEHKAFFSCEINKLSSYLEESKEEKSILPRFANTFSSELKEFPELAQSFTEEIKKIEDDKKLIAEIDLTATDLSAAFNLGIPDPFPYTEFEKAINAQKNPLHALWWEKEWDDLKAFAKTIYIEWDRLRDEKNFQERIRVIERNAHEYSKLKRYFEDHINALSTLRAALNDEKNEFCRNINAQIREAFLRYKAKEDWEKMLRQCNVELKQLDKLEAKQIVAENIVRLRLPMPRVEIDEKKLTPSSAQFKLATELKNVGAKCTNKTCRFTDFKNLQKAAAEAKLIIEKKDIPEENKSDLINTFENVKICITENTILIQNTLFATVLALIKEVLNPHNIGRFWAKQIGVYSSHTIGAIQVPNGVQRIYANLPTIANAPSLMKLIDIADERIKDSGCFTFFMRKPGTTNIYQQLRNLRGIIDDIYHYKNLDGITQGIDAAIIKLRGFGLRIDDSKIEEAIASSTSQVVKTRSL
ncbi:MAG: hypothetical protein ACYCQI_11450 [Gammaproteobacteria bacterium]